MNRFKKGFSLVMLPPLPVFRRFAATILIGAVGLSAGATVAPGYAAPLLNEQTSVSAPKTFEVAGPVSLDEPAPLQAPVLLAHHDASVGTSQLLTTGSSSLASSISKSLWGNMVLSMAIQQDDQIQLIAKKLGRLTGFVFTSVGLISALGVAQSIDGLVTLEQDPHPYHPPILGLVGSGLSLVSVATQATLSHRYKKQLAVRQDELAHQVSHLLERLKSDGPTDAVQTELSGLIGAQGAEEFLGLWQAAHPH
jgi:hypothetical protein